MQGDDAALQATEAAADAGTDPLEIERELGRRRAEVFDLELCEREARHLVRELCRSTPDLDIGKAVHRSPRPDPGATDRHRELLRHHLRFCRALATSRPWRLVQTVASRRFRPPVATTLADADVAGLDDDAIEAELAAVSAHVRKVLESREWRLLQGARGIFGRRW